MVPLQINRTPIFSNVLLGFSSPVGYLLSDLAVGAVDYAGNVSGHVAQVASIQTPDSANDLSGLSLHLHCAHLADPFIQSNLQRVPLAEEGGTTIYRCRYSKDVHRTECQGKTIAGLTHSRYTTKLARIRCSTMLRTIFKCKDVQLTISV